MQEGVLEVRELHVRGLLGPPRLRPAAGRQGLRRIIDQSEAVAGRYGLRLDLRDYIADDAFGAGTTNNYQATLGLTVSLP